MFLIGKQEVTTIEDKLTGCIHKSELHAKDLFQQNESIKLNFNSDLQMGEIIKPNLPEVVYVNRKCGTLSPKNVNPYEWVGIEHNNLLDIIGNNVADVNNITISETYYILQLEYPSTLTLTQTESIFNEINQNIEKNIADYYYKQGLITIKESLEYNKLAKIIKSEQNIKSLITTLLKYESSIIQRNDLTIEEGAHILRASAVARYSSEYWNNAINNPNNVWHESVSTTNESGNGGNGEPFSKERPKLKKIFGDVWGLIVGDVICGPPCGVFLGGVVSGNM